MSKQYNLNMNGEYLGQGYFICLLANGIAKNKRMAVVVRLLGSISRKRPKLNTWLTLLLIYFDQKS